MFRRCPVPNCSAPVPEGKYGAFCLDHHFLADPKDTSWIFRLQMKIERERDEATKEHMREQLHAYVRQAVRTIEKNVAKASQAATESARRQASQAVGADLFGQVRP